MAVQLIITIVLLVLSGLLINASTSQEICKLKSTTVINKCCNACITIIADIHSMYLNETIVDFMININ